MGRGVRRDDREALSARAAQHGFKIIIRLDDLDQAILGGTVAAIGVGMVLLHQRLVFRLDVFQRGFRAQPHHLQRLALGVEDLAGLRLAGLGTRTRPPAAAAVELAEHAERIGRAVQLGFGAALLAAAIGAHFPGRTMAGQRVLLVARDRFRVHAGEEIVGLIVFAHMVETEVPVLARILAALGRAVWALVRTIGPFAPLRGFARLRLLLRALLVR